MSLPDRQAAGVRQGAEWEEQFAGWVPFLGCRIEARHWTDPQSRVEIDYVLRSADGGPVWVECAGSYEAQRNGLERTDTVLKKIGAAYALSRCPKRADYWLVVSHLPRRGSAGERWLALAQPLFDWVVPLPRPPRKEL